MTRALLKALALMIPLAILVYIALGTAYTFTLAMQERATVTEAKR